MTKRTVSINVKPFGLPSLLTILFVYLKLTSQIDWSWLWVLAPTWIPAAIGLSFFVVVFGIMLLGALLSAFSK